MAQAETGSPTKVHPFLMDLAGIKEAVYKMRNAPELIPLLFLVIDKQLSIS
jgi:hypothetical protein